jgi:DNA polymerase-4
LEQVSIDEAFLDISGTKRLKGDPLGVAMEIKERIRRDLGLTCSIGMAPNKFIAKIASDMDKPDGLTVVQLEEVAAFLARLPISKIPGVGKKTVEKLKKLGVETVGDVQSIPEDVALKQLGKYGRRLLELSNGIDESEVVPFHEVKSVSTERTFSQDTTDREMLRKWLLTQAEEVGRRLRRNGLKGRTVNLKVKYHDFTTHTRSRTLDHVTDVTPEIYKAAAGLLDSLSIARPVRLIGVGVSSLDRHPVQLRLFDDENPDGKRAKVDRAVDAVKDIYGKRSIRRGSLLDFDG